jgi:transposase-like protein
MKRSRSNHSAAFKAKVALAMQGAQTLAQLAARFDVHPTRITQWKAEHGRRHAQIPAYCSNERHREPARASGTHATHACDAQSRNEWLRLAVML